MENNHNDGTAREDADQRNDWQNAERAQIRQDSENESFDLKSANANGYGAHDKYEVRKDEESDSDEDLDDVDLDEDDDDDFDQGYDDDDDEEDNDDDDDDDDDVEEPRMNDWGAIDPQNNGIPDGNDPAASGSAV